jgi:SAM-dependent methyltransferase
LKLRGFKATAVAVMNSLALTGGVDQDLTAAAVQQLRGFREQVFGCLPRRGDALFELIDALLAAESMPSLPHLSLQPAHRRGWGSVYAALALGELDADRLADVLTGQVPQVAQPVFAVDASTWARCDAECSPGRGFYYSPTRHSAGQPIVVGWCYSWIAQLGFNRDSWTAPVDAHRVPAGEDLGRATAAQIRALTARLRGRKVVPLFVFDAGYDPIALTVDLADAAVAVLVRIRSDRVFYTEPAARAAGQLGRPRRHGARLLCADPTSWPPPQQTLTVDDEQYGRVQAACWAGLHPKLAGRGRWSEHDSPPIVTGTVIRVQVEHLPRPTARALKTLWLWWAGPGRPDLDLCWRAYIRRFDLEHTFRFCKQALGWTTPRVRTPEQADRWTWLVLLAYTELRLARPIAADARLPWERPLPARRLTPGRIRRDFPRLLPLLGTPASPPKPCGRSPGRPIGSRRGPAPRQPAIKKAAA